MRVLYAVFHPLPVSESYIRNEIEWLEKQGIEIGIWARHERLAVGYPDSGRRYWIGEPATIGRAIDEFKPMVVHAHPLFIGQMVADDVERKGLPLTIRGHVGFTGREPENVFMIRSFLSRNVVSKLWTFPHICRDIDHYKAASLPASYFSPAFVPGVPDLKRFVLRIGTALPAKGWEEFVKIAERCPAIKFVAALAIPNKKYAEILIASGPKNLTFYKDLQRNDCVKLMQASWIYLRGHDPGPGPACHRYGMPISIAEALGCGVPVIARDAPEAREYIGPSGIYYRNVVQAVLAVTDAMIWPEEKQKEISDQAVEQARLYRDDVNYPQVLSYWRQLARWRYACLGT